MRLKRTFGGHLWSAILWSTILTAIALLLLGQLIPPSQFGLIFFKFNMLPAILDVYHYQSLQPSRHSIEQEFSHRATNVKSPIPWYCLRLPLKEMPKLVANLNAPHTYRSRNWHHRQCRCWCRGFHQNRGNIYNGFSFIHIVVIKFMMNFIILWWNLWTRATYRRKTAEGILLIARNCVSSTCVDEVS